jgi:hypothetical protein
MQFKYYTVSVQIQMSRPICGCNVDRNIKKQLLKTILLTSAETAVTLY